MPDAINRPNTNGTAPVCRIMDGTAAPTSGSSLMRLKEYPFKAGELGPNGMLEVDFFGIFSDVTDTKEFQVRLVGVGGSFTFHQSGLSTSLTVRSLATVRNLGNEAAQVAFPSSPSGTSNSTAVATYGAIDTAQPFSIEIWGAAYGAGDVATLLHVCGKLYQG